MNTPHPKSGPGTAKAAANGPASTRPIAGPTHEKTLPVGDAPLQLYSLGTPNGIKITVMLEELRALGKTDAAYDLHIIKIGDGEQFGSDFVKLNPNSKIPVLLDQLQITRAIRVRILRDSVLPGGKV